MSNLIEVKPVDVSEDLKSADIFIKAQDAVVVKYQIKSQLDLNNAVEIVRGLERFSADLEKKRLGITKPLDEAKKAVMDLFRPCKNRCENVILIMRGKINDFAVEAERERQRKQKEADDKAERERIKAQEKAEAARKAGDEKKAEKYETKAAEVQNVVIAQKHDQPQGTHQVTRWRYEILDPCKLPRSFLIPDHDALQGYATATQGKIPIEGVRIYAETSTTIRK